MIVKGKEITGTIHGATWVPISEFARIKKVGRNWVYQLIADGKIIPEIVGATEVLFIDLEKYGGLSFTRSGPRQNEPTS